MPNITVDNPPATPEAFVSVLPGKIQVKNIDRKSDDWVRYHFAWDLMYWLYAGGVEIENQAEQFLKRRPKELSDVYQKRVEEFTYQNHCGTAIDWYLAALFEEPPRIEPAIDPGDETLKDKNPTDLLKGTDLSFYERFNDNCDRAGTPLIEVCRSYFKHLLIYNRAVILVDLPRAGTYQSLFEQKQAGQFDPYLVNWDSRQVINYSKDSNGCLDWIVFNAREKSAASAFEAEVVCDRWYYYDRQQYAVYERIVPEGEDKLPDNAIADLKNSGRHALADQNMVPVIYDEVPEGLWLMNRAYLSCKDHLNTDNVHAFALKMAALAMPVVKMDGEFTPNLSEAGFIKLPLKSEYTWSEPDGKSFVHLANRALTIKEEIYRAFYLISQARSLSATAEQQSGASKQQDMMASKKVMNLYGSVMRNMIQRLRNMISLARQDKLMWDVRGLSFPEAPPNETIELVAAAGVLEVPSDTFEVELNKRAVDAVFPDMNPAQKNKIYSELEKAPNKLNRQVAQITALGTAQAQIGGAPGANAQSAAEKQDAASADKYIQSRQDRENFKDA